MTRRAKHKRSCPWKPGGHMWCQCGVRGSVKAQQRRWELDRAKRPGHHWRMLAQGPGSTGYFHVRTNPEQGTVVSEGHPERPVYQRASIEFDEMVVDHWFHLERMDHRAWWARVGDARLWIKILKTGEVEVSVWRGEYGPVLGPTQQGAALLAAPLPPKRARKGRR